MEYHFFSTWNFQIYFDCTNGESTFCLKTQEAFFQRERVERKEWDTGESRAQEGSEIIYIFFLKHWKILGPYACTYVQKYDGKTAIQFPEWLLNVYCTFTYHIFLYFKCSRENHVHRFHGITDFSFKLVIHRQRPKLFTIACSHWQTGQKTPRTWIHIFKNCSLPSLIHTNLTSALTSDHQKITRVEKFFLTSASIWFKPGITQRAKWVVMAGRSSCLSWQRYVFIQVPRRSYNAWCPWCLQRPSGAWQQSLRQ